MAKPDAASSASRTHDLKCWPAFFQACVFNVGCMKTIEANVQVMNEIQKGRL